jgi:hypothetical protein
MQNKGTMNVTMEIKPMKGLGELEFGMKAEDVEKILGTAEEVEEIDEEEVKTLIWHYWSKGISVFFDEEHNNKLSSIELDNTTATLWGNLVFDMKEKELIELFKEKGYKDLDEEEHEWGEKRVSFDDAMIDLYFEEGELSSINYGVFLNDFEIAVWPN